MKTTAEKTPLLKTAIIAVSQVILLKIAQSQKNWIREDLQGDLTTEEVLGLQRIVTIAVNLDTLLEIVEMLRETIVEVVVDIQGQDLQ